MNFVLLWLILIFVVLSAILDSCFWPYSPLYIFPLWNFLFFWRRNPNSRFRYSLQLRLWVVAHKPLLEACYYTHRLWNYYLYAILDLVFSIWFDMNVISRVNDSRLLFCSNYWSDKLRNLLWPSAIILGSLWSTVINEPVFISSNT